MVGFLLYKYDLSDSFGFIKNPLTPYLISVLILTLIFMRFISFIIIKPLNNLVDALQKISQGDFEVKLDENSGLQEFRNMNKNFNRMAKELSNTETLRNDFVSNVSHEFKTPLSSIEGYASLMLAPDITKDELQVYAKKIMTSTKQLSSLTGNILALSRLNTGTINETPVLYSLDEQIRESILMLEQKWTQKNIDLEMELPEVNIMNYQNLLFQVWTNIYSNAIKFSPDNSTITTLIEKEDKVVKVRIRDQGIGINEEQIHHIFDKFYQADTAHKSEGNGLGLAICASILKLSGGSIQVHSAPGKGSEFIVFLPYSITA
ncbi:sensor histidine kinase [Oribacterium sp. P6A1]|uniref:sensor histidine kinase n=1 Tax=Oribacterium sp. P6A1 TaxID=1410612 RepID=UPI000B106BAC|nr:HAMP domain-containing sensor histidine kinase [Oribacterium sp. P6A1]